MHTEQIKIIGHLGLTIGSLDGFDKTAVTLMVKKGLLEQHKHTEALPKKFHKLTHTGVKVYDLFKNTLELF